MTENENINDQKYQERMKKIEEMKKSMPKDISSSTDNTQEKLLEKLNELDKTIIDALRKKYNEQEIEIITRQLQVMYKVIAKTELKYQHSTDYREALDMIMNLIVAGQLL